VQSFFCNPRQQESRTIPKLHAFAFAIRKKTYNVTLNEHYLHKIEDCTLTLVPDQPLDRSDVFDLNSPANA
jgi:hypothetical protein